MPILSTPEEFQREILDRLITLETLLTTLKDHIPESSEKIRQLELDIIRNESSITTLRTELKALDKDVHNNLSYAYRTVFWVASGITLFINALVFVLNYVKQI